MTQLKWLTPTEKELESAILAYLNYRSGCFAFKVNTMGVYDQRQGFYRRLSQFVLPGTPDVIASFRVGEVAVFIGLEVKTEKGRQSEVQKAFQEKLESKSGGFYFIVRSIKETEQALDLVHKKVTAFIDKQPVIQGP